MLVLIQLRNQENINFTLTLNIKLNFSVTFAVQTTVNISETKSKTNYT